MQGIAIAMTVAAIALRRGRLAGAPAQTYPSRPITMVVPFPAGGPTDTLARILAERMRARSASRSSSRTSPAPAAPSASARVARAAPDGYTLSIGNGPAMSARRDLSGAYDVLSDFEPVSLLPIVDAADRRQDRSAGATSARS